MVGLTHMVCVETCHGIRKIIGWFRSKSGQSWRKYAIVNFLGTETAPSSGVSSPTTIRNSVVLPDPLGPTSPTFSPGFNWKEASTKSNCLPYCLLMFEKEIILKERLAAPCLFQCSPARKLPADPGVV